MTMKALVCKNQKPIHRFRKLGIIEDFFFIETGLWL